MLHAGRTAFLTKMEITFSTCFGFEQGLWQRKTGAVATVPKIGV
jgi:hypothetical protein